MKDLKISGAAIVLALAVGAAGAALAVEVITPQDANATLPPYSYTVLVYAAAR